MNHPPPHYGSAMHTPVEIPLTTLGRGGPTVSRIGLGLAALGRPGYLNVGHHADLGEDRSVAAMRARAHAVLDAAVDLGITYVDAARSYGRAEEFLATWTAPSPVTIGSKWGYTYTADWRVDAEVHEVKDHSLATFRRQRQETAALLGDRLGLYQIHSATLDSGVLDDAGVLEALRAEPVMVGLSVSGPGQADTIRRALSIPDSPFRCVQATWNVLEPSAGPALQDAHDAGWGVIVKEGLANGRLTDRGDHPLVGAAPSDALAIAAVLAQPFVDVVLSGAATVAHLRANAAAVAVDPDELPDLRPEEPRDYWSRRAELPWT